ncbi:4-amino-4-deoxychorismate lyase [Shimia isoporae]|uniref:Probable branched-chain-amino-acid aminotransferase n=1 Tax=Shimia isoporae TaxID=647720 RepID=A0A4R1NKJ5_9RHOB|nr:aminotransferase class IV family protein [Shimia isoporae]TCL08836.1 4-amino-4-deoxychorismate lyase [Shimia isoporae]
MESPFCEAQRDGTRLIETFGYRPGQGIARLDLHLKRLERSAAALGFEFEPKAVQTAVAEIRGKEALRCRLTLGAAGDVEITTAAMPPAANAPWVFRIAEESLSSADPYLQYKTTRRAVYDRWRADLPDGVQEWVFLNEHGEVCEGTITNITVTTQEGERLTPPIAAGCLPGVYRESRLRKGLLVEARLTLEDLRCAKSINLVNSLRGSTNAHWDCNCSFFR